jgi:hypothetical protein
MGKPQVGTVGQGCEGFPVLGEGVKQAPFPEATTETNKSRRINGYRNEGDPFDFAFQQIHGHQAKSAVGVL